MPREAESQFATQADCFESQAPDDTAKSTKLVETGVGSRASSSATRSERDATWQQSWICIELKAERVFVAADAGHGCPKHLVSKEKARRKRKNRGSKNKSALSALRAACKEDSETKSAWEALQRPNKLKGTSVSDRLIPFFLTCAPQRPTILLLCALSGGEARN